MSFMTEPQIEDRQIQPYMGIRARISMQELSIVIPEYLEELFAFLGKWGVEPVRAPFIRYHFIKMPELFDIEVGVPVANALVDEGRIQGRELPAGRYASLIYTGIDNGIQANAALLAWGTENNLVWDSQEAKDGETFGARLESFLTRPDEEQDRGKWETEVAIRLADSQAK